METNPAGKLDTADSVDRLNQVIESVIRRRAAGESLDDATVIASHADLLPHLAEKLHSLRLVERAEQAATSGTATRGDAYGEGSVADDAVARQLPAASIPGYTVLSEIHRGGQGVVYKALQHSTDRTVAIKVMREGPLYGARDKARFDREIRILARLKHPNIVSVHDSGQVSGGRYFVMDYIPGESLDTYIASKGPSAKATLLLFQCVCKAVNAAHLRGVTHRDLKPGNIQIDEAGEPHILDFGLAKIAAGDIDDLTGGRTATITGQFVGSIPWASPEQAEGLADEVDLRTDVYSLGVILFYMLTRQFPYPVLGTVQNILRNIVETIPSRPSSIRKDLDDEISTITLKCLSKEPDRRYQSAGAIADDIGRHLSKQPILARAPSTMYQLKKLAIRHKLPFALLVAIFVLLSGFAVWLAIDRIHDRVIIARALQAERRSTNEAEIANAINEFLVNDLLTAGRPDIARGQHVTVAEVLENASDRIEGAFPGHPLVEASVRETIGQSFANLGMYEAAEPHLRTARAIRLDELGEMHADTLQSQRCLIKLLENMGRYDEAEPLAERHVELARRLFGEEHEHTLEAIHQRALLHFHQGRLIEAEELMADVLEKRRRLLGEEHPSTLMSLTQWGYAALVTRNENALAEKTFRQVLETCERVLGESQPQTIQAMSNVAHMLMLQRKFAEAERLFERSLEGHRRIYGSVHPMTLQLKQTFAQLRQEQDRLQEATVLLREVVVGGREVLGPQHPTTAAAQRSLGLLLGMQGAYVESEAMLRESLALDRRRRDPDNLSTSLSLETLGISLAWLGRHAEAEECFRESCQIIQQHHGEGEGMAGPLRGLVQALGSQGKHEEARPFAEQLLRIRKAAAEAPGTDAYRVNCFARELLTVYPTDLRDSERALQLAIKAFELSSDAYHYNRYTLALAYEANEKLDDARRMITRALEHIPLERSVERTAYETAAVRIFEASGDQEAAEQVHRNVLMRRRDRSPSSDADIAESLERLGDILVRHGKYMEAEHCLRECLELRADILPADNWRTGTAASILGGTLAGQNRYAEAEPLLVTGFTLIATSPMAHSMQATSAFQRLEKFYNHVGRPECAAEYRSMLAQ